jgi:hypothetical protein
MNAIRQKVANEQAVAKLEGFLLSLKLDLDEGNPGNFSSRQKQFNVSNSTTAACKALQIIGKEGSKYKFKSQQPPRTLALLILDYFLKQNKKTMRGDIMPDFEPLMHALGNIFEKLNILTVQNEVSLKRLKTGLNGNYENTDLFKVDEQRLYIAGQISSGIYFDHNQQTVREPVDIWNDEHIEKINNRIVYATDNLLANLREGKNENV